MLLLVSSDLPALLLVQTAAAAAAQAGHAAPVLLQVQVSGRLRSDERVAGLESAGQHCCCVREELVRLVVERVRRHRLQQLPRLCAQRAVRLQHEGHECPAVLRALLIVLLELLLLCRSRSSNTRRSNRNRSCRGSNCRSSS